MSRLVAKILLKVGMLKDSETKKAGLLLAGQSYAKVFVLDNLGVFRVISRNLETLGRRINVTHSSS